MRMRGRMSGRGSSGKVALQEGMVPQDPRDEGL